MDAMFYNNIDIEANYKGIIYNIKQIYPKMTKIYNETLTIIEKLNGHKSNLQKLDLSNKMLLQGNEISLVLEGNIEISFESTD